MSLIFEMPMVSDAKARLREEVTDLYYEYASALDEGPLEHWPELFAQQCSYRLIPRENYDRGLPLALIRCDSRGMLADRVMAVERLSVYAPRYLLHLVSNVRILGEADGELITSANYAVYQTRAGRETTVFNVGRYIDRLVREDQVLRFREKICVFDSTLVQNSIIYPI